MDLNELKKRAGIEESVEINEDERLRQLIAGAYEAANKGDLGRTKAILHDLYSMVSGAQVS